MSLKILSFMFFFPPGSFSSSGAFNKKHFHPLRFSLPPFLIISINLILTQSIIKAILVSSPPLKVSHSKKIFCCNTVSILLFYIYTCNIIIMIIYGFYTVGDFYSSACWRQIHLIWYSKFIFHCS